jgi:hypothetical protein
MNRLISGVDNIEAAELAAEATAKVAQQAGDAKGAAAVEALNSDSDSGDSDNFDTNAAPVPKASPTRRGGRATIVGMTSAKVASTKRIKDIQGSCLYQMNIPDSFNEKTYGKLFQKLSTQGIVPLGLLRGTFAGLSVGPRANRAPYVYTNPEKDTEIFKCDKIFVLSTKPIQADSKLDLKVLFAVLCYADRPLELCLITSCAVPKQDWLLNMQQNKALRAAEANPKRPGSATATLDTLDLTQKKLDARITKLSKELNHKMDGLMKMISSVGSIAPRGKSFAYDDEGDEEDDDEYYTLDGEGSRVRRGSIDSTTSGGTGAGGERVEYQGAAKTRKRAESAGSAGKGRSPAARPSSASMRASAGASATSASGGSDKSVGRIEHLNPASKSRSLSKFTPSGILRKPSLTPELSTVSQKKRHSFSTPIATVHDIVDPSASFQSAAGGANVDGPLPTATPLNTHERSHESSKSDSEDEDEDEDSLQSAPPREDSPHLQNGDTAGAASMNTPSKSHDEEDDRQLREEGKQATGSWEESAREESTRSLDSEAATLHGGSEKGHGTGSGEQSGLASPLVLVDDIDSPVRSISRKKPAPEAVKAPVTFSPIRKRADVVVDRATISGPPVEMALHAMNNNKAFERSRAYSANEARGRNSRDASPTPDTGTWIFSAGHARREL